jgi:small redox-active disulfide protein 2
MSETRKIEVLGPGCSRCRETFRVVDEVVRADGLAFEVVKDETIERMMALGLMATPGVALDGKVILSGRVPKPDEVRRLIGAA